MKYILVTGAAGFIGYNLCKKLLEEGNQVVGVDNFCSGTEENIDKLKVYEYFHFIEHDVIEPISFDTKLDEIYHLACPASPLFYQKDPIRTMITCVVGTKHMLALATLHNAKILFASTSEVYGDPEVNPQYEQYRGNVNSFGPRACYDEGKRAAEALCYDYWKEFGTNIRIVRIFNTFGPGMRMDDGRVVTNFIKQCLNNKPMTVYGTGKQKRSLNYIDNLLHGIELLMKSDVHEPVNIGDICEIEVNLIAKTIKKLTGSSSEIIYKELPQDDPMRRRPDLTKARSLLGYEKKINYVEGLKKTIEYFKNEQT